MAVLKILKKILIQKAVYWTGVRSDGLAGITSDKPVQIDVRWTDVSELMMDASGKEFMSKSKIIIDTDFSGVIETGGYLFKGTLASLGTNTDIKFIGQAVQEIRRYHEIPTLSGEQNVRIAWL